jgi:hypothetical protein
MMSGKIMGQKKLTFPFREEFRALGGKVKIILYKE